MVPYAVRAYVGVISLKPSGVLTVQIPQSISNSNSLRHYSIN